MRSETLVSFVRKPTLLFGDSVFRVINQETLGLSPGKQVSFFDDHFNRTLS